MNNKTKRGFTLIELLVVIAIIGILATLAVVALQQARKNARDAKRIADVKQIQTALELYYNEVGSYPELASITANNSIEHNGTVYMAIFPSAPTPADGNCNSSTNQYSYTPTGTANSSYQLSFCLGNQVGNINQGEKCATPAGILTTDCAGQISGGGSTSLNACNNQTSITDSRDGNVYPIVAIGDQCWMAKNLAYLPNVHGPSTGWNSTEPRYAVYNYSSSNNSVAEAKATDNYINYGALYNWPAVMQNSGIGGGTGICPEGWRVPTDTQWTNLTDYLDGVIVAGGKIKGITICGDNPCWNYPNTGATNETSFTAWPGGYRNGDGSFGLFGSFVFFWSSSENSPTTAWRRFSRLDTPGVGRDSDDRFRGFSIRCLKN